QEILAKIIAKAGKYVQTSAKYGASRKGGMVVMNARVSAEPIRICSDVSRVETLAVFNDKYLLDNSLLKFIRGIRSGGYLVVNTVNSREELIEKAVPEVRDLLAGGTFNLVLLDASGAAQQQLKRNLPGTPILGAINRIIELLPPDAFREAFRHELAGKFSGAKAGLVDINLELLEVPYQLSAATGSQTDDGGSTAEKVMVTKAREIYYDPELRGYLESDEDATLTFPSVLGDKYRPLFIEKVLKPLRQGEDISWDEFYNIVPAGTSSFNDASLIGTVLPVFDPQKCISCGLCIAACPDNALRVTVVYDHEYENLAELVQNLFRPLDLSGNPDPENFYPRPRKIKGEEKKPTSFRDVVNLLGQFVGDRQTIDEIVRVNERQNLYLWCLYQYRAGLRDDVPAPEEIERLIEVR
ncbi:MAG: 2-oxoacid:acceptor oxidoreductase family protein, partial [Deltaproteobacteria bacterium]|nr:2-oxoacid:acceptor oxidoreductase family protein [Deltaproteobacteria bacterium]